MRCRVVKGGSCQHCQGRREDVVIASLGLIHTSTFPGSPSSPVTHHCPGLELEYSSAESVWSLEAWGNRESRIRANPRVRQKFIRSSVIDATLAHSDLSCHGQSDLSRSQFPAIAFRVGHGDESDQVKGHWALQGTSQVGQRLPRPFVSPAV